MPAPARADYSFTERAVKHVVLVIPFLLLVALVLPMLAWSGLRQSRQHTNENPQEIPLRGIVIQIAVIQTIVAALAGLAIYGAGLKIPWGFSITPLVFGVSWLTLGIIIALAFLEASKPLGPGERVRRRLRRISAGNPAWIGATVYAGIVEEFAYRGVLTFLLASWMGFLPGALVSALLFGLAHLSSGKRAVTFSIPFALAMQGLVHLSGGLIMAIIIHAAYDLIAAWIGNKLPVNEAESNPQ